MLILHIKIMTKLLKSQSWIFGGYCKIIENQKIMIFIFPIIKWEVWKKFRKCLRKQQWFCPTKSPASLNPTFTLKMNIILYFSFKIIQSFSAIFKFKFQNILQIAAPLINDLEIQSTLLCRFNQILLTGVKS